MRFPTLALASVCLFLGTWPCAGQSTTFDGSISRATLEQYLARSITMLDLLTHADQLDENLRMLRNLGARYAGRAVYRWGGESQLPQLLPVAKACAARIHAVEPEMILEACEFEIVSEEVERLHIRPDAFQALGRAVEDRNFRYAEMLYPDGYARDQWGHGASVPDISRPETKLWFVALAFDYLDIGVEAIHFGQVELMNHNDPDGRHWAEVFQSVRRYAAEHARRHLVLCNAHVPSGGLLVGEQLLLDFHAFPLRIKEVPERPQEGVLEVGYIDSFYGRSRGGIAPSGWRCEHLPYLVELDNWGASDRPGQPGLGGCWAWGYDEISWFAHQPEGYRNQWLRYAVAWLKQHDPNAFLEMPGSRCLHAPVDGQAWYYANTRSPAMPAGFNQEETIKALWTER